LAVETGFDRASRCRFGRGSGGVLSSLNSSASRCGESSSLARFMADHSTKIAALKAARLVSGSVKTAWFLIVYPPVMAG
jgi:hypothetical protein